MRVVDLSADFRLARRRGARALVREHGAPELRGEAVFGLTELHRDEIAAASLVANPGCYSTAAILALAPLARAGLIADAVVDAKSGVSGAGREATERTHFVSADENVNPYAVDGHRHAPEIDQELAALGLQRRVTFVPHLLPLDQGLLASCYVTPTRELRADEVGGAVPRTPTARAVHRAGRRAARRARRARHEHLPDPRHHRSADGRVLVFAAIDNLWKGAAGQAVQNLNLMLGTRREPRACDERGHERHLLPLALGRCAGRRARARAGHAAGAASARPASPAASSPPRRLDIGVVACDGDDATSAALFTRNALVAAAVELSRAG